MLVRVCEEVLCARLARSPNERQGEICEMIFMQKGFCFCFFGAEKGSLRGQARRMGGLCSEPPELPEKCC